MFSAKLLVQALLATAVLAIPNSKERLATRTARRQGKPANLISAAKVTTNEFAVQEELSSNWAGAILIADTATYVSVTGTFTVPNVLTDNDNVMECAAAWVGIDGSTGCEGAILQTGIDFCVASDEKTQSFDAWYEFFPADVNFFDGFPLSVGDSITATATVFTPTSGSLTLINNSKDVTMSVNVTSSTASLCQTNAEWIIEDYTSDPELPNWGTVTFTDAFATTLSGAQVTPGDGDATLIDIELFSPDFEEDEVMTQSSVDGNTVAVKYAPALGGF
ncbi:peptidase A4 family-domain-containing protein [Rhodocollybia butyracea]|uniref:Peptidase A4 family-domain-containing protein n=1 Tax=Rhodocollybia butyracea TaxID=206335 RepID=A0A9P5TXX5_9AGAR|nr:peptidase A4 family-domain-containing protein [Rhodocollybia butyracea]